MHSGQIFMLYEDPKGAIDQIFATIDDKESVETVVDEYGVTNEVFPVVTSFIQKFMADKKLIIADGHHRYETALTYRNEQRAAGAGDGAHDWLMMTFVNMSAPGLIILPTHRVVFGLEQFSAGSLVTRLREFFDVEPLRSREAGQVNAALEKAGAGRGAFALITRDAALLLRARPLQIANVLADYGEMQRRLDVLTLHKIILEHVLGISEEDIREQKHVRYQRWAADAIHDVDGGANAAFLMNAVPVDLLRDLTFAGTLMPQKSTDFYPKLLSGLTLYSLDESFEAEGKWIVTRAE
jgi:uncharacterized protein (DUF1015 family)